MDEDMILPDDFVEAQPEETTETETEKKDETTEEVTETEQTSEEEETSEVEETQKEEPKKLKVKYLHEEKELTEEEAIPLIQKGLNHDRILEQLNTLKADPRLTYFETLAKEQNMTTEQYIQSINDNIKSQKIQAIADSKGWDYDSAKEFYEAKEKATVAETANIQQQKEQEQQKAKVEKENAEFLKVYPDVKVNDIPNEVWELVKEGLPLLSAYIKYENAQLQSKLKNLEQKQENKKKAIVRGVTNHGSQEIAVEDDFMTGFNSD